MMPGRLYHFEDLVLLRAAGLIERYGYDPQVWYAEEPGPFSLVAAVELAEEQSDYEHTMPVPGVSTACPAWCSSPAGLLVRHWYATVFRPRWTREVRDCPTCMVCPNHAGNMLAMFDNPCRTGCDPECPGFGEGGHHSATDFMHPLHMASGWGLDETIHGFAESEKTDAAAAVALLRAAVRSRSR